jgi:hypothetical protein
MRKSYKFWVLLIVVGVVVAAAGVILLKGKLVTSEGGILVAKWLIRLGVMAAVLSTYLLALKRFSSKIVFISSFVIAVPLFILYFYQDKGNITDSLMFIVRALCSGVGFGLIFTIIGPIYDAKLMKDQRYVKWVEVNEKDERNRVIKINAKAKTYDFMVVLFGALTVGLAIAKTSLIIVAVCVAANICVVAANAYYMKKLIRKCRLI